MVFSPLIPRRTDLTKEHIIGNGGGEVVKNSLNISSRKRKITPSHGVCGQIFQKFATIITLPMMEL